MARPTPLERWESKVDKSGDCWLWTGPVDRYGYGKFSVDGRTMIAHRWGYAALVGSIPEGLTIDHVCHSRVADECAALPDLCLHRRCVNPQHLEPVTHLENLLRGGKGRKGSGSRRGGGGGGRPLPTCRRGHEWTPENTLTDFDGRRRCKTCRRVAQRNWYLQRKAA